MFDPPEYVNWKPDPGIIAEFEQTLTRDSQRASIISELTEKQLLDLVCRLLLLSFSIFIRISVLCHFLSHLHRDRRSLGQSVFEKFYQLPEPREYVNCNPRPRNIGFSKQPHPADSQLPSILRETTECLFV